MGGSVFFGDFPGTQWSNAQKKNEKKAISMGTRRAHHAWEGCHIAEEWLVGWLVGGLCCGVRTGKGRGGKKTPSPKNNNKTTTTVFSKPTAAGHTECRVSRGQQAE